MVVLCEHTQEIMPFIDTDIIIQISFLFTVLINTKKIPKRKIVKFKTLK